MKVVTHYMAIMLSDIQFILQLKSETLNYDQIPASNQNVAEKPLLLVRTNKQMRSLLQRQCVSILNARETDDWHRPFNQPNIFAFPTIFYLFPNNFDFCAATLRKLSS